MNPASSSKIAHLKHRQFSISHLHVSNEQKKLISSKIHLVQFCFILIDSKDKKKNLRLKLKYEQIKIDHRNRRKWYVSLVCVGDIAHQDANLG